MKKRHSIFGFTVLLLAVMFALAACDSGDTAASKEWDDFFVDVYSHASTGGALTNTLGVNKEILKDDKLAGALEFLADVSHYLYTWKDLPSFQAFGKYPDTWGFDTEWRSALVDRVYRGPYHDPLTRSICWLTINPNGSINCSLGSYWGVIRPNTELPAHEAPGYVKSDKYQAFSYCSSGQSVNNWKERKRGTLSIDGALADYYGVPGARHLFVEVKLNHFVDRVITPEEFYDGLIPESWSFGVLGRWGEHDPNFMSITQYWAATPSERNAYIAKANDDPVVKEILSTTGVYMYYDIMQINCITDLIGFEYEATQGKINGVDRNHDGYLDKYPNDYPDTSLRGKLILTDLDSSPDTSRVEYYVLEKLNYKNPWWVYRGTFGNAVPPRPVRADGSTINDGDPETLNRPD